MLRYIDNGQERLQLPDGMVLNIRAMQDDATCVVCHVQPGLTEPALLAQGSVFSVGPYSDTRELIIATRGEIAIELGSLTIPQYAAVQGGMFTGFSPIAITGQLVEGQTLTARFAGVATGAQWVRNGSAISGATNLANDGRSSTYTVQAADVVPGTLITCRASGLVPESRAVVANAIPPQTNPPVLTASPMLGQLLAYTAGQFSGAPTPTVTFTLSVGGLPMPLPYTPTVGDVGKQVVLTQIVTNSAGQAQASVTATVLIDVFPPTVLTVPVITSPVSVGSVATFTPGTFGGSIGTRTVQWLLDGSPISGATGSIYTPTTAGVLSVRETMTNQAGSVTATSAGVSVGVQAGLDTRPRYFVGPANAHTTGTQAYLDAATVMPGSANGGKSSTTWSVAPGSTEYGWAAVLDTASEAGVVFRNPLGVGGWQGAGLPGNYTGPEQSPSTSGVLFIAANGVRWRLFRQSYRHAAFTGFIS